MPDKVLSSSSFKPDSSTSFLPTHSPILIGSIFSNEIPETSFNFRHGNSYSHSSLLTTSTLPFISDGGSSLLPLNTQSLTQSLNNKLENLLLNSNSPDFIFDSNVMCQSYTLDSTHPLSEESINASVDAGAFSSNNIPSARDPKRSSFVENEFCCSNTVSPELDTNYNSKAYGNEVIFSNDIYTALNTPNILTNDFVDPSLVFTTPFMSSKLVDSSFISDVDISQSSATISDLTIQIGCSDSLFSTSFIQTPIQLNLGNGCSNFYSPNPNVNTSYLNSNLAPQAFDGLDSSDSGPRPLNKKLDSFKSSGYSASNPANLSRHSSFAPLEDLFESFIQTDPQSSPGLFSTTDNHFLDLSKVLFSSSASTPPSLDCDSLCSKRTLPDSFISSSFEVSEQSTLSIPPISSTGVVPPQQSDCSSNGPTSKKPKNGPDSCLEKQQFGCPVCLRSFGRKYNLKTHMTTHPQFSIFSKKFPCSICNKAFTRKHDLKRHMSTIH
ncbi:Transcriptional regulator CRZ1 [Smittium mucronatum]|uniref:Transcriptional regulator CRZ1 n=1 Tax=Smittium mucronatum TaxID=133383 RepID=A0A1R0GY06_9FUNG|nr:Transcriptional regulator CRZ1 [Smittium mucronatum]